MEEKYIDLLLKRCLSVEASKILFVDYNTVNKGIADKVFARAKEIGYEEIYLCESDDFKEHDILKNISYDDIEKHPYFDASIWNEYALKGANFLCLITEFPGLMDDIEPNKLTRAKFVRRSSRTIFREKELAYEIHWCMAAVPNEMWAKSIFNEENAYDKLYKMIMDMCMVDTKNPIESWNEHISNTKTTVEKLNDLKIKSLNYKNSLGTDLHIELPDNVKWMGAGSHGDSMIVNMPSYEVFTTPDYTKTEGIVYSSRPLINNGGYINDFYIEFKNGKVINYSAKEGLEILKGIIESDSQSCYLGEVALVDSDSPISRTNKVFGMTLFDENASCHLALGAGFVTCLGDDITTDEAFKKGINKSNNHVDFMIGTNDLDIIADTKDGKKLIFKKGHFNI